MATYVKYRLPNNEGYARVIPYEGYHGVNPSSGSDIGYNGIIILSSRDNLAMNIIDGLDDSVAIVGDEVYFGAGEWDVSAVTDLEELDECRRLDYPLHIQFARREQMHVLKDLKQTIEQNPIRFNHTLRRDTEAMLSVIDRNLSKIDSINRFDERAELAKGRFVEYRDGYNTGYAEILEQDGSNLKLRYLTNFGTYGACFSSGLTPPLNPDRPFETFEVIDHGICVVGEEYVYYAEDFDVNHNCVLIDEPHVLSHCVRISDRKSMMDELGQQCEVLHAVKDFLNKDPKHDAMWQSLMMNIDTAFSTARDIRKENDVKLPRRKQASAERIDGLDVAQNEASLENQME